VVRKCGHTARMKWGILLHSVGPVSRKDTGGKKKEWRENIPFLKIEFWKMEREEKFVLWFKKINPRGEAN
jgi:hypothetical protein